MSWQEKGSASRMNSQFPPGKVENGDLGKLHSFFSSSLMSSLKFTPLLFTDIYSSSLAGNSSLKCLSSLSETFRSLSPCSCGKQVRMKEQSNHQNSSAMRVCSSHITFYSHFSVHSINIIMHIKGKKMYGKIH